MFPYAHRRMSSAEREETQDESSGRLPFVPPPRPAARRASRTQEQAPPPAHSERVPLRSPRASRGLPPFHRGPRGIPDTGDGPPAGAALPARALIEQARVPSPTAEARQPCWRASLIVWRRRLFSDLAEREGFEPPVHCCTPLFESGTINHSDTSPFRIVSDGPNLGRTRAGGRPRVRSLTQQASGV